MEKKLIAIALLAMCVLAQQPVADQAAPPVASAKASPAGPTPLTAEEMLLLQEIKNQVGFAENKANVLFIKFLQTEDGAAYGQWFDRAKRTNEALQSLVEKYRSAHNAAGLNLLSDQATGKVNWVKTPQQPARPLTNLPAPPITAKPDAAAK